MITEPEVTINGQKLSEGQVITIRVAISSFLTDLSENGLGNDDHGKRMAAAYLLRGREIESLMTKI